MLSIGRSIILLVAYVAASSTGLLLLKSALGRIRAAGGPLLTLSQDTALLAVGLILYVLSFALWVCLLARVPLSSAFPSAIGLTLAFTTLGSALLLGDRVGTLKLIGILFIFAGCVAINLGEK